MPLVESHQLQGGNSNCFASGYITPPYRWLLTDPPPPPPSNHKCFIPWPTLWDSFEFGCLKTVTAHHWWWECISVMTQTRISIWPISDTALEVALVTFGSFLAQIPNAMIYLNVTSYSWTTFGPRYTFAIPDVLKQLTLNMSFRYEQSIQHWASKIQ